MPWHRWYCVMCSTCIVVGVYVSEWQVVVGGSMSGAGIPLRTASGGKPITVGVNFSCQVPTMHPPLHTTGAKCALVTEEGWLEG